MCKKITLILHKIKYIMVKIKFETTGGIKCFKSI